MKAFLPKISIPVNQGVYLKDPNSSELGRRIITGSIDLIDEIGFEGFTFKKLAQHIGTTEASVYRYFESKHRLLLYLTSWFWGWLEYQLVFRLANIESPWERLERAIHILTSPVEEDLTLDHINEVKLYNIVTAESSKAYLTKLVDEENKEGLFAGYKALVARISEIITEINPDYRYPRMLISTVIEGAHHQRFFAQHLPRLTDIVEGEDSIPEFYRNMVFSAIKEVS